MSYTAVRLVGDLMIAPLSGVDTSPAYFFDAINATKLTLNTGKVTQIQRLSRKRDTVGTVLTSLNNVTEGPSFSVQNDEYRAQILALQLRGGYSTVSGSSGTITDESIAVKLGEWVPLANSHLSASAIVATGTGGTPTYTENTHYVVNRRLGLIKFLAGVGGAPVDGATALIDYAKGAYSVTRVAGSTQIPSRYAVQYDGINQASGKNCVLRIPQAVIAPDGNLELITDQFMAGTLLITPELKTGESASYYYDEDD